MRSGRLLETSAEGKVEGEEGGGEEEEKKEGGKEGKLEALGVGA